MFEPASTPYSGAIQRTASLAGPGRGLAAAVLDTHVVLDHLVFRNPSVAPIFRAITAGRLAWIATPAMRSEFGRMLIHPCLERWNPDGATALSAFDSWATSVPPAARLGEATRLRCTDPDDQMFIDTALEQGASWLLTRDRALLKLARRARLRGLTIGRPDGWTP